MIQKRLLFCAAFVVFASAVAFSVPQVAVLDTILAAGMDKTVAAPITDKIIEEMVNSGKYKVIDRANVEQVLREKEFQLSSGVVRNEEVRQAGEYLGADYVIVANAARVGTTFTISAKMIDVVSGEIVAQASSEKKGSVDVLLDVARTVGRMLAGQPVAVAVEEEQPAKEPLVEEKPPKEPEKKPEVTAAKPEAPQKAGRFIVGVKGGGNMANVMAATYDWYWLYYDDYILDPDEVPASTFGLNAGAYFTINLNRFMAIQAEVLYSQKGYTYYFEDFWWNGFSYISMGGVTNLWTFNYLEVPLLAKLRLPGSFSPYAVIGASIGMLLGGSVENVYDVSSSQSFFDANAFYGNPADINDLPISLNTLDVGIVVGAGVDITLGSVILNIDIRYTYGLFAVSADFVMTNSALTATAGVGFPF